MIVGSLARRQRRSLGQHCAHPGSNLFASVHRGGDTHRCAQGGHPFTAMASSRFDPGLIDWNSVGRRRTKKQRPKVRIPDKLFPHLRRARLRGSEIGFVIHDGGKPVGDPKKSFGSACQRAGLENVTPHTLRHTRTTWGHPGGRKQMGTCGFSWNDPGDAGARLRPHHPDYQKAAANAY